MAYGSILGQNPTAQNTLYNNAQTSSIITANNVQGAIDQLFTSVSNGKQQIASAITDKGVSTSGTDSFATMAENIGKISTGPFKEIKLIKTYETTTTTSENITLNTEVSQAGIEIKIGDFIFSYLRNYSNYYRSFFSRGSMYRQVMGEGIFWYCPTPTTNITSSSPCVWIQAGSGAIIDIYYCIA